MGQRRTKGNRPGRLRRIWRRLIEPITGPIRDPRILDDIPRFGDLPLSIRIGRYWYLPAYLRRIPVIAGGTTAAFTQTHFRWRNDDGSETTATWKANEDVNILIDAANGRDINIRLRVQVDETAGGTSSNFAAQLRYSHNGGAYTDVTGTSSVARASASSQFTDEAATTAQLTAPTGTFLTGAMDEANGSAGTTQIDFAAGQYTEVEYSFQIRSADTNHGDTIDFRVYRGTNALNVYSQTARATITHNPLPGAGSISIAGQAAVLALGVAMGAGALAFTGQLVGVGFKAPETGTITLTGLAPTLTITADTVIQVPAGAITIGGQPSGLGLGLQLDVGAVALTGQAPIATTGIVAVMPAGAVSFTGQAPVLSFGVSVPVGSVTFTGIAPSLTGSGEIALPAGAITLAGQSPGLGLGVSASVGSIIVTGLTPTITVTTQDISISVPVGAITLAGLSPILSLRIAVPVGSITIAGGAPAVLTGTRIAVPAGAIVFDGQYVSVLFLGPDTGTLTFTGYAPQVFAGLHVPSGAINLTGRAPTVQTAGAVPVGSIDIVGRAPTLALGIGLQGPGQLNLIGLVPTVVAHTGMPAGSIALVGLTPGLSIGHGVPVGSIAISGTVPIVGYGIPVPVGEVTVSGQAVAISLVLSIPVGAITITGMTPSAQTGVFTPGAGAIVIIGQSPALALGLGMPVGTLNVTGLAPLSLTSVTVAIPVGSVVLTGLVPTVTIVTDHTRMYFNWGKSGYTPPAFQGGWDADAAQTHVLDPVKWHQDHDQGPITVAGTDTSATVGFKRCLLRLVSRRLAPQTISGTVNMCAAVLESNADADFYTRLHIYIQKVSDNSIVGTLLNQYEESAAGGATEWPTTQTARALRVPQTLTPVIIPNDGADYRIVAELGFIAYNSFSTSRTGTLFYGSRTLGREMADLTVGEVSQGLLKAGYLEFSGNIALAPDVYQNVSPETATEITDLNQTFAANLEDAGINYERWYKYTAPTIDQLFSWFSYYDVSGVHPTTYAYYDTDLTVITSNAGAANGVPIEVEADAGVTLYIRVRPGSYTSFPALAAITIQQLPVGIPINTPLLMINDDSDNLPAALINADTGAVVSYKTDIVGGEGGDRIGSDRIILENDALGTGRVVIYNQNLEEVTQFNTGLLTQSGGNLRAHHASSTFVVGGNLLAQRWDLSGSLIATYSPLPVQPRRVALSLDASILYYTTAGVSQAIRRWDTVNNVAMSDLAAAVSGFVVGDIFVLSDGNILVTYVRAAGLGTTFNAKVYAPNGTVVSTITFGNADIQATVPRAFWHPDDLDALWIYRIVSSESGFIEKYRISTGTLLLAHPAVDEFSEGAWFGTPTATPPMYGVSPSCPLITLAVLESGEEVEQPGVAIDISAGVLIPDVDDICIRIPRRLGDPDHRIWSEAEIDRYLQQGLKEMCTRTRLVWDWTYVENLPRGFSFTNKFDKPFIDAGDDPNVIWKYGPEDGMGDGLGNYTAAFERRVYVRDLSGAETKADEDLRDGFARHTYPDEIPFLSELMADHQSATADLPHRLTEIERSLWDKRTIEAQSPRFLAPRDSRYELQEGEVHSYTWRKDGPRTFRKIQVPAELAGTYEIDGLWGIARDVDDVVGAGTSIEGTWGIPRQVPGEHPIGPFRSYRIWGTVRRFYQDYRNVRVEHWRIPFLDCFDSELPPRYRHYLVYYVMWRALHRQGPGQDFKLGGWYKGRWEEALQRIQMRLSRQNSQRVSRLGGTGPEPKSGPPRPRLPWQYGKKID